MRGFKHTYARFILMKQRGNEEELPNNSELTALRDCKSSASGLNKRCNVKFLHGEIKTEMKNGAAVPHWYGESALCLACYFARSGKSAETPRKCENLLSASSGPAKV